MLYLPDSRSLYLKRNLRNLRILFPDLGAPRLVDIFLFISGSFLGLGAWGKEGSDRLTFDDFKRHLALATGGFGRQLIDSLEYHF